MSQKDKKDYSDFSNVKSNHDELIPEEFPEGPLGSSIRQGEHVQGKSTAWKAGQRRQSAFVYTDKGQHNNLPRQAPGAHPLHDESD